MTILFEMNPNSATKLLLTNTALFAQVSPTYVHTPKVARPANPISTTTFYLKWYLVYPAEHTFSAPEVQGAQSLILAEVAQGKLALYHEVGFVVQHRC